MKSSGTLLTKLFVFVFCVLVLIVTYAMFNPGGFRPTRVVRDADLKEAVRLLITDYLERHTEKIHYRPDYTSETTMLSSGDEISMHRERYIMEKPDGTWEPITWKVMIEREKREKAKAKARMAKLVELAEKW